MKTLFLLGFLALAGCAWMKEQGANINACQEDPACWSAAVTEAGTVRDKAKDLADLSPIPGTRNVVGSVAGYAALVFFLAAFGAKLKEEK